MWVVPAGHFSQVAKYATFCDMFMLAPHLFEGLMTHVNVPEAVQECNAARIEAISEWEKIKSIDNETQRLERMTTVFLEVFTWSQDFHLRTASALVLLKLGKAEDQHCFHFFSLLANPAFHANLGFPLAAECALALAHWRVSGLYTAHRTLQMSFSRKTMGDAVKLLMQKVQNDERQPFERKQWAKLLALWVDSSRETDLTPEQLKDDKELYLSFAICREDKEILRDVTANCDSQEMRKVATDLLTRLGEPPSETFGAKDEATLKDLLRMVRGALNPKVLEQIFREATQHQALIWNWLKGTGKSEWKDDGLRTVLLQHIAGPFLAGLPQEHLANYLVWIFEIFAEDGNLRDRADLDTFLRAWDERVADADEKAQEQLWFSRAYAWRFASARPEEISDLVGKLRIILNQTAINQLSGWDRTIERLRWKSDVREGHFILAFAGTASHVAMIREKWNLREEEPVPELLWQAISDGHPHAAALLTILSSAYKGIPALKAAVRRFVSRSVDDIVGDPLQWSNATSNFYSLYDSVEFLDWIPATPDSWNGFFADFDKRFHAGKPELGRLNAWIKFAGKLKVRLDQSPEVWEPLLRRFLKGWQRALDCANGVVREHDYKQADGEMAKTLLKESSSLLCLLAG